VATSTTNAAAALGDMTRFAEMRKRLCSWLGALVVYRVGTFIPVPGIDAARFAAFFSTRTARCSACSTCSRAARCSASAFSR
jgi:preprotein translocase subunit SecY